MPPFKDLPIPAQRTVLVVTSLGAAFLAVAAWLSPRPTSTVWFAVAYLAVGTQLAALVPIRWSRGMQQVVATPLVAMAFIAPGGFAPAAACWLCTYDGRRPGRDIQWWAAIYNRANLGLSYGVPAVLITHLSMPGLIDLPAKTLIFGLCNVVINWSLTAMVLANATGGSIIDTLLENVAFGAIRSLLILSFAGGLLYVVLSHDGGYILAIALFGFVFSVRTNMADAQREALARLQTLRLAAQALDVRDHYTESHSVRVADLAAQLGEQLELSGREIELLKTAGSLHDLGKIGVRDSILNKAGPLTPDEWEEMRRHPDIGADMIARHSALAAAAPFVRFHHERWDGTGYPTGLKGSAIPLGARILAVADSYDTITAERIYRRSHLTPAEAIEDISARANRWYDPAIVDALRSLHGHQKLFDEDLPALAFSLGRASLFRHRRFIRLLLSTAISALGDPLTLTAAMAALYTQLRQPLVLAAAFSAQAVAAITVGTIGGALPDRWRRSRLIPSLELSRAIMLFLTPLAMSLNVLLIVPILFLLAAAEGIVQPARQAAVAEVVDKRMIGVANATLAAVGRFTWAIGGAVALFVLLATKSAAYLFVADGLTFLVAGLLTIGMGELGGGVPVAAFRGVSRALAVRAARPHLVLAAAGALFLSMSFPALVILAYARTPSGYGSSGYGLLQFALGLGISAGALIVSRAGSIGSMRTAAVGLAVTGLGGLAIAYSSPLWATALLLFAASIGNSIYAISNQTALLEVGVSENRGSIMSFRFAFSQACLMVGTAVGGALAGRLGAGMVYALLGAGLLGLAVVAAVLSRYEARPPAEVPSPEELPADRPVAPVG